MLDVTQKTAWFLNHRIRGMFSNRKSEMLQGVVEVDETYVGGKDKNRHKDKKKGSAGKTMVVGAVQRGGIVKAKVIPAATTDNVSEFIAENIQENTNMVTDESHIYKKMHLKYLHDKVNHTEKEYVRGKVHTNTIEGFWNILKKQVNGIHHSVSPKHLQRYTNECAYRYNQRGFTQDVRFAYAMTMCDGRLRYQDLIATNG